MMKILNGYKYLSLLILNTIVLILLLELVLGYLVDPIYKYFKYSDDASKIDQKLIAAGVQTNEEYNLLIKETREVRMEYAPWTDHSVNRVKGKYVNVSNGVRFSGGDLDEWWQQGEAEGDLNVYVFGGSTAFGFGVPDEKTIPAQLKQILNQKAEKTISVYNYAAPYYYSRQEVELFSRLLLENKVPDIAIFIDGLNDVLLSNAVINKESAVSPFIKSRTSSGLPLIMLQYLRESAVLRALVKLGVVEEKVLNPMLVNFTDSSVPAEIGAMSVFNSYKQSTAHQKKLCKAYDVICINVWQPVPFFHYKNDSDKISKQKPRPLATLVYNKIDENIETNETFLNYSQILEGYNEQPFVDGYHYSVKFSEYFANKISQRLEQYISAHHQSR